MRPISRPITVIHSIDCAKIERHGTAIHFCIITWMKLEGFLLFSVFCIELEIRQEKGYIDKDVILLTAEDPKSQVGSGGATLNALLMVSEYISAKQGFTVSYLPSPGGKNIFI